VTFKTEPDNPKPSVS
jgi:hypothetical protein